MLPLIGFFVAGFFWNVWPWGLVAAAALQLLGLALGRAQQLAMWWERSPRFFASILAVQIATATALHGAVMFGAGLIRYTAGGAAPW